MESKTKHRKGRLHISDLQRDLTCHVFTFLDIKDRAKIQFVCKSFHQWSQLQQSWSPRLICEKAVSLKDLLSIANSLRGKRFTSINLTNHRCEEKCQHHRVLQEAKTQQLIIGKRSGLPHTLINSLVYPQEIRTLSFYSASREPGIPLCLAPMLSLTALRVSRFSLSDFNALLACSLPLQYLDITSNESLPVSRLCCFSTLCTVVLNGFGGLDLLVEFAPALPSLLHLRSLRLMQTFHTRKSEQKELARALELVQESKLQSFLLFQTCYLTDDLLSLLGNSSLTELYLNLPAHESVCGDFLSTFVTTNKLKRLTAHLGGRPPNLTAKEQKDMKTYFQEVEALPHSEWVQWHCPLSVSALSHICQLTSLTELNVTLRMHPSTDLACLLNLRNLQYLTLSLKEDPEMSGKEPMWMSSLPSSLQRLSVSFTVNVRIQSSAMPNLVDAADSEDDSDVEHVETTQTPSFPYLQPLRPTTFVMCLQNLAHLAQLATLDLAVYWPLDFKVEHLKCIAHLPLQRVALRCTPGTQGRKLKGKSLRKAKKILKGVRLSLEF